MAVSSAVVWDLPDVSLVEYDIDSLFDPKNHGMKSSTPRIKSSALEPASKTFEFTVPHMIGQRSIDAAGDTNLVWAFKASGGWGKHSDKAYSTLNLATGAATAPILSPAKVLHIVCMALAWGLFLPLGIVQSMAFKRGPCSSCGPWWFVAHIVLNVIGLGTMLVGGFFAFRIVPDGAHWTDPHHVAGGIVIFVTCLQPLNAFIRPHAPKANPPNPAAVEASNGVDMEAVRKMDIVSLGADGKPINGADTEAVRKMDIVSLGADGKPVFRNWLDLHRILRPGGHATHGTKAVRANTTFVLRLLWECWHKGCGYFALVMAIIAIYSGIKKLGADPAVTKDDIVTLNLTYSLIVVSAVVLVAVKVVLNFTVWRTYPTPSTCSLDLPDSLASKVHPIGGKIAYCLGWTPWNLFELEAAKVRIEKEKETFVEPDDTPAVGAQVTGVAADADGN